MRRFLMSLMLLPALMLAACNPAGGGVSSAGGVAVSNPLRSTTADERAIHIAFITLDATATAIDRLIDAKVIVPGSDRANKIADALSTARTALNTASRAQQGLNSIDPSKALQQAEAAISVIRSLL